VDETFGAILISLAIPAQAGVASRIPPAKKSQIFHRHGAFLAAARAQPECDAGTRQYAPSPI
jgi:hypothetical protein